MTRLGWTLSQSGLVFLLVGCLLDSIASAALDGLFLGGVLQCGGVE